MIFNNPSQSRESVLIIEWGKHSLSFSVFHEQDNRVLATEILDVPIDLFAFTKQDFEKLIKENEIFAYSFQKVVCLVDTEMLTLVPKPFFSEETMEEYVRFNLLVPSGKLEYRHEQVLSTDYQAVYVIPKALMEALDANFLQVSYSMTNVSLLNYFSKFTQIENFFGIHFNQKMMSVFYYQENKLKYFNCFEYLSAEDIIYHVLNVMNELALDNERELVYYSGMIIEESENLNLLKDYVKFLKAMERSNKMNYQSAIEAMPSHYFIQHYASAL